MKIEFIDYIPGSLFVVTHKANAYDQQYEWEKQCNSRAYSLRYKDSILLVSYDFNCIAMNCWINGVDIKFNVHVFNTLLKHGFLELVK